MACLALVIGTRPEAIKMAPLILELKRRGYDVEVILSGQHREMAAEALSEFGLTADRFFLKASGQLHLNQLASVLLYELHELWSNSRPHGIYVHGDTTTALTAALCAYLLGVRVFHVEAGLRTGNLNAPWPEEFNRRTIALTASWHYAPSLEAKENLLREGVPEERIFVTGNTVIDAVNLVRGQSSETNRPKILVTTHRRENHGESLRNICKALKQIVFDHSVNMIFPVHPNPMVRDVVYSELMAIPEITLCDPLGYRRLIAELSTSLCVITDSGGIQEEASFLGKPVVVVREQSERSSDSLQVVGTEASDIVLAVEKLLTDANFYSKKAQVSNQFGDGKACERIVDHLGVVIPKISVPAYA